MTTQVSSSEKPLSAIELSIGGMTCASCAARIEKKLNRIDGVSATVNFATEKAKVAFPDTVTPDDLVAAVEATGYTAALPPAAHDTPPEQEPTEPDDAAAGGHVRDRSGARPRGGTGQTPRRADEAGNRYPLLSREGCQPSTAVPGRSPPSAISACHLPDASS